MKRWRLATDRFQNWVLESRWGRRLFSLVCDALCSFFFMSLIFFPKKTWKVLGIVGIVLYGVCRVMGFPTKKIKFLRKDLIFFGMVVLAWLLLLGVSVLQVSYGISDAIYVRKQIELFIRIFFGTAAFLCISRNLPLWILCLSGAVLFAVGAAEYFQTGGRVALGDNPNTVSIMGMLMVFPALYLCEFFQGCRLKKSLAEIFAVSAVGVIGFGASRAIVIGAIFALFVYILSGFFSRTKKNRFWIGSVCIFVLAALSLAPSLAFSRIEIFMKDETSVLVGEQTVESKINRFSSGRLEIWDETLKAIRDSHPFVGIGGKISDFKDVDYFRVTQNIHPQIVHPHNMFLAYWLKFGIAGVLARILLSFAGIVWGILCLKDLERSAGAACLLSFSSMYLFVEMFDCPYWLDYTENCYIAVMSFLFVRALTDRSCAFFSPGCSRLCLAGELR